ncbi:GGDEF domain-containing protein [Cyanobium sp. ATX 6F1]|uniref:GGDEF domain-containing protein n=1 Tax=unclassified Cyanobium TaxID=2627006 RepID=UPI0020CB6D70|nr:sensor domain-containing diguanylate cyclase [Cyanobium sp. ATX 6F1]MCP9915560.1 sensor domain-containing diguanylate cyclase [Cyanobium sp. ATX 6F1]
MYPDYPLPRDEPYRQRDLERYGVLDQPSDQNFDRLVRLASTVLDAPIALISLIDHQRQWFLARHGLDATETPREMAFCAHAIVGSEPLVVNDARSDLRFCNNPLVIGEPGIRFYAGAPLESSDGHNLGTLCVIDRVPRTFSADQVSVLQDLADLVVREMDLRRQAMLCPLTGLANKMSFMELGQRELNRSLESGKPMALLLIDIDHFARINNSWGHQIGDELLCDVAEVFLSNQRQNDLIGRIHADEFAILMVDCEQDEALERSEIIRYAITRLPWIFSVSHLGAQASSGLAELTPTDRKFKELLDRAERALLEAKNSGLEHQIVLV